MDGIKKNSAEFLRGKLRARTSDTLSTSLVNLNERELAGVRLALTELGRLLAGEASQKNALLDR